MIHKYKFLAFVITTSIAINSLAAVGFNSRPDDTPPPSRTPVVINGQFHDASGDVEYAATIYDDQFVFASRVGQARLAMNVPSEAVDMMTGADFQGTYHPVIDQPVHRVKASPGITPVERPCWKAMDVFFLPSSPEDIKRRMQSNLPSVFSRGFLRANEHQSVITVAATRAELDQIRAQRIYTSLMNAHDLTWDAARDCVAEFYTVMQMHSMFLKRALPRLRWLEEQQSSPKADVRDVAAQLLPHERMMIQTLKDGMIKLQTLNLSLQDHVSHYEAVFAANGPSAEMTPKQAANKVVEIGRALVEITEPLDIIRDAVGDAIDSQARATDSLYQQLSRATA